MGRGNGSTGIDVTRMIVYNFTQRRDSYGIKFSD